jgi:hypothetical protein
MKRNVAFWQSVHVWFNEQNNYTPYNMEVIHDRDAIPTPSLVHHSKGRQRVLRCDCTSGKKVAKGHVTRELVSFASYCSMCWSFH